MKSIYTVLNRVCKDYQDMLAQINRHHLLCKLRIQKKHIQLVDIKNRQKAYRYEHRQCHRDTKSKVDPSKFTFDLVLSISAVTVLFSSASLAGASVKTKMSEEGGAAVSADRKSVV